MRVFPSAERIGALDQSRAERSRSLVSPAARPSRPICILPCWNRTWPLFVISAGVAELRVIEERDGISARGDPDAADPARRLVEHLAGGILQPIPPAGGPHDRHALA